MNGCWIPDTPIAVDYWRTLNCPAKLFFLSHMHADHTCGLSSSWKDKIYCSELSAKLLKAKFNIRDELIFPLSTGLSHVVELDSINSVTMTVTLIDAHHCPGAVMFLFEGYFGTLLYTGDFRFCKEMLADLEVLKGKSIDTLYFDNTYNSPEFQFPSRNVAKEQIKQIINDHQDAVVVFGMFTLGKEDLLVDLAKYFETYVVVSPEKFEQIKYLDLPDVFTTNIDEGWIHVEKRMKITHSNVAKWNKETETIAIVPTALYTNYKIYSNIYNVEYSDHSSYHELLQFVAQINPRRLIPIVKNGGKYAKTDITNLHKYDAFLDKTPTTYVIPEVFCSSSLIRVVKKNFFNGLKRKHCVGVQFDDSPEKKIKMLEQDDLHKRNEYIEKNVEDNEMKENNKVVDQSDLLSDDNGEEFAKLSIIKHNSNYLKKPLPHLIQLFSGQSVAPTYKTLDDTQETNSLQQNTFDKKSMPSPSCNQVSWSVEPNLTKNCWLSKKRIPFQVSKVSGPHSTKLCHRFISPKIEQFSSHHKQLPTSAVKEKQICGMIPTKPKAIHSKFEKLRQTFSGRCSVSSYETTNVNQINKSSLGISHYFKRKQSKLSSNKMTQSVEPKLIEDCPLSKTSIPCTVSKLPEEISTKLCSSTINSISTETNSSTNSSMTAHACASTENIESFSSQHQQSSTSVVDSCAHYQISRNLQSPVENNLTILKTESSSSVRSSDSNLIQKRIKCTKKICSRRITFEKRLHDECIKELIDSLDFSDFNPSD